MSVGLSVADVLADHVGLEVECVDRMYLNAYVPRLQYEQGVVGFFRGHRGWAFASSALMEPITDAFVAGIRDFAHRLDVPLVAFRKGERKDDVAKRFLAGFERDEGVLFIGRAQEKTPVFRTQKRRNPTTGKSYAWIVRDSAMVNHFYVYCVDADFGPFFLKFCSYFPYNAKLCLNGHHWAQRQADAAGLAYEALDNGFAWCEDPPALQAICDRFGGDDIDALLRRWLGRLPHPFTPDDRAAGYRYDLSVLQAEFSLTQVLDRPLSGRVFFEEVIRDNLDIGRPDQVSLTFARRVIRRTPGRFRTRVLTDGVVPSLHVDYKSSRIKQYCKEGRALRTETTVNDTRDFDIGRRLCNLPALRQVGFSANRRLLGVQRLSHDCALGEDTFRAVTSPIVVDGQRASALRFDDARVQALLSVLVVFRLLPRGFANRDLRALLAQLLAVDPSVMTQGRMTYDLRRLRLHGLIERIPQTHRFQVTDAGLRVALFFTRAHARLIRTGLAQILGPSPPVPLPLRRAFDKLETAMDDLAHRARIAA
jgi:hypothetical protein